MPRQIFVGQMAQLTSQACLVDLTPPTFAGLVSAVVQSRGQIRAAWAAAVEGVSIPVRYEVYVKVGTATGLFNSANIIGITDKLQLDFWQTPDGAFLVNGSTYFVGVRVVDAVGNRDSNTVSASLVSTGVFTSADIYKAEGSFVVVADQLQGTLWILKNSVLGLGATLGTASYQVYDKTGTAVPGMGQTGITADANGQFKITPVASVLSDLHENYLVRVDITMDSAVRSGYVPLVEPPHEYNVEGVTGLNESNQFVASFWASADEQVITGARLGTAAYQVYDRTGAAVAGMNESGIAADAAGLFKITPVTSGLLADLTFYSVKVSITIDGVVRSDFLPIMGKVPAYECFAAVSVNALNQFQATLHCEADGRVKKGAGLGTGSYQIFDAAGVAVAGLNQSGITADANGRFITTPVSAVLLTDLTHYSMTIKIFADGIERESIMGFGRLGT